MKTCNVYLSQTTSKLHTKCQTLHFRENDIILHISFFMWWYPLKLPHCAFYFYVEMCIIKGNHSPILYREPFFLLEYLPALLGTSFLKK